MKKIAIIILNYNGFEDTLLCLKSLPALRTPGIKLFTIVVDNCSTDQSVTKLKKLKNKLSIDKIIVNEKNFGFAKGNNIGIRYALDYGVDYILLLNNDTKIVENFLPRLLKIDADIISPVVKFREFPQSKNWIYDYGGFVNWSTGRTTHLNTNTPPRSNFVTLRRWPDGLLRGGVSIDVDYIAGCCMLIKRNVFDAIGLFDEAYFIYFEDVDYCITAKKHGFRVVVDPQSLIYHKLGGSMDRWSGRAIYRNLLGNFIFITKHLGARRITGYTYLGLLTAKIIRDKLMGNLIKKLKVTR